MTTHSSIISWKIPWAEEPGGLQSMGSQRVKHDWHTHIYKQKTTVQKIASLTPLKIGFSEDSDNELQDINLHPFKVLSVQIMVFQCIMYAMEQIVPKFPWTQSCWVEVNHHDNVS